jgi:hypothetical protein
VVRVHPLQPVSVETPAGGTVAIALRLSHLSPCSEDTAKTPAAPFLARSSITPGLADGRRIRFARWGLIAPLILVALAG